MYCVIIVNEPLQVLANELALRLTMIKATDIQVLLQTMNI